MKKEKIIWIFVLLLGISNWGFNAAQDRSIKLRFFEGVKEGMVAPTPFVTSSYLQSTYTAHIRTRYILAEEQEQIKNVFNLSEVNLITEADLMLGTREKDKIMHMFRLNETEYIVLISKEVFDGRQQFKVEVFEESQEARSSLLDTEIQIPETKSIVFGFENKEGKPYFLSLGLPQELTQRPIGVAVGGAGGISNEELERGAIKAIGEIKPPVLVNKVHPVYPELARKARVEGVVILNVRTDENGNVDNIKVTKSKDPLLNRAAIDAVKKWKYQPYYYKGEPRPIVFTVTVHFKLTSTGDEDRSENVPEEETPGIKPQLILRVEPVYPERARRDGIEGVVVLKIKTDSEGNVTTIDVVRSESTMLNQAAIEAVQQWKYRPVFVNGNFIPFVTTVRVIFKLD